MKPSAMPQSAMYRSAARYSAFVTLRASLPSAPGWGVYWLMRENSTSPGRKVSATQSMTAFVFSSSPGSTRCRMRTPLLSWPFSILYGPVWRNISKMAAFAVSG